MTNTKTIDTIPQDVEKLLLEGKEAIGEENLQILLSNFASLIKERLSPNKRKNEKPTLRMSKLGTPDRKLWYEFNTEVKETKSNQLKFLYGDLIEQLVLFLIKEAGHEVKEEQSELVIEGIVGHKDARIDGYTTDVKSASNFGFRKFKFNQILTDDPFGYVAQLSAYMEADKNDKGAFLAVNKETGELAVTKLHPIDTVNPEQRIRHLKEILKRTEAPEKKCYEPIPEGKSGNFVLNKNCTFCPFKATCWGDSNNGKGLRMFRYASGVKHFTTVVAEPNVPEVLNLENGTLDTDNNEGQ